MTETTAYDGDNQITTRRVYTYSVDELVPGRSMYYGADSKIYESTSYTDYRVNSKGNWISEE